MKSRIINFFTSQPNTLITIILALFAAVVSIWISARNIDNLRVEVNQKILNISNQSQIQNLNLNQSSKDILAAKSEDSQKSNEDGFHIGSWIFYKETLRDEELNKEGYFCPQNNAFPSWFMWSKNKSKADSEVSISFSLLDKTNDDKNPTLYFSYGDKSADAPDSFYRLNILDGDLNTLRLYDRNGREKIAERSINRAPMDKFITLKIFPVFPNKRSSTLLLNPTISYQLDGKQYDFDPKKEFNIDLPFTSSENQGDGFQYGLGISKGDCFKIISSNL